MKVPLKITEKGMGESRHGGKVLFMQTFELGVVDVLNKFREAKDGEGVGGGVTHVKGHKGAGKLKEVANGEDHVIQLALPSLNKVFPLHHCLL